MVISSEKSELLLHSMAKLIIDMVLAGFLAGRFVSFVIFEHYFKYFEVKIFILIFLLILFSNGCIMLGTRANMFKMKFLIASVFVSFLLSFWIKTSLDEVPTPVGDFFEFLFLYLILFITFALISTYLLEKFEKLLRIK